MIDSDGQQLGVMATSDAQRIADGKELDLVEVAPTAAPPVCRIMDYGKFKYAEKKKAQQSRKKTAASQLKEVKLGSQTSGHDVDFKVGHIRDFLGEGHRVKVTIFFRGRSITHPELGQGHARPHRRKGVRRRPGRAAGADGRTADVDDAGGQVTSAARGDTRCRR